MNASRTEKSPLLFTCLEGGDAVGKGVTTDGLVKRLEAAGLPYVQTREPGGCPVAEDLRSLILTSNHPMDGVTQLLLLNAARREHINQVIMPAAEAGKIVLCDRFVASTLVYQTLVAGPGKNISEDLVMDTHRTYCGGLEPTITFCLDVPSEVRRARQKGRNGALDRFENGDDQMADAIAAKYREVGRHFKNPYLIVDANRTPDDIADDIFASILKMARP